jgi:transcriptional repressor of cell division inhibition gene dicB
MKKRDVVEYFGSITKAAEALKINSQAISQWPDDVPELRAYQIEVITGGALRARPEAETATG